MKANLAIVVALSIVGVAAAAAPPVQQYAGEATLGLMMRDLKSGREVMFVCAPFTPPAKAQPAPSAKTDMKVSYEIQREP